MKIATKQRRKWTRWTGIGLLLIAACTMNPATGELQQDVWARWLEHDPLCRIDSSSAALQKMSLIYVDAGNRDEHGLHFAARMLKDALQRHGLPVRYEEYEGGHRGTSWRYEVSLPQIVEALQGPE